MQLPEIETLSHFGKVLWGDPEYSRRVTAETLSAVSLLDLQTEQIVERALTALIERASRDGVGINARFIGQSFFRLRPVERCLLAALHQERWSYKRVARVLRCSENEVASAAWKLRLQLAASKPGAYPTGTPNPSPAGLQGHSCPEYNLENPWTQRFLDEELSSRERHYLQNHMMVCARCRQSLSRCRDLYFAVEAMIPNSNLPEDVEYNKILWRIWRKSRQLANPLDRTLGETLEIFFSRTEVRIFLLLGLIALGIAVFKM